MTTARDVIVDKFLDHAERALLEPSMTLDKARGLAALAIEALLSAPESVRLELRLGEPHMIPVFHPRHTQQQIPAGFAAVGIAEGESVVISRIEYDALIATRKALLNGLNLLGRGALSKGHLSRKEWDEFMDAWEAESRAALALSGKDRPND